MKIHLGKPTFFEIESPQSIREQSARDGRRVRAGSVYGSHTKLANAVVTEWSIMVIMEISYSLCHRCVQFRKHIYYDDDDDDDARSSSVSHFAKISHSASYHLIGDSQTTSRIRGYSHLLSNSYTFSYSSLLQVEMSRIGNNLSGGPSISKTIFLETMLVCQIAPRDGLAFARLLA